MANSKEIKFDIRAELNTASFDERYEVLKKRLSDLQKTSERAQEAESIFGKSQTGQRAQEAFQRHTRSKMEAVKEEYNNKAKFIQNQEKELSKVESRIKTIEDSGKKNLSSEKEMNKLLSERNRLQDNITEKQSQQFETLKKLKASGMTPEGFRGVGDRTPGKNLPPPPGNPPPTEPPKEQPMGELVRTILRVMSVDQIVRGALNTASYMINREAGMTMEKASVARLAGGDLSRSFFGGGTEQMFNIQERVSAAQKAAALVSGRGQLNIGQLAGSTLVGGMAGAKLGAMTANPAGALIGGALGATGGLLSNFSSERMMARMFDPERFQAMQSKDFAQEYEKLLEAEKAQDPRKQLALKALQASGQQDIQAQRMLALSDFEYRGAEAGATRQTVRGGMMPGDFGTARTEGWLQRQMRTGGEGMAFLKEEVIGAAQGLIQAGGTTESARNLSGESLRIQRDLRQQNAQSILGRLSGAGLQGQEIEIYKKVMTEAVKSGVNLSTMPQELMRFSEAVTNIATQGGGFSERAAALMGAGMTDFNQQQIQGAASAYEQYQQAAGESGGMEGQIGAGFLMSKRGKQLFGKLSSTKMNVLNQMTAEDLQKRPELLAGLASDMNMDPEELIKAVAEKDVQKQTRTKDQEENLRKLGERVKGKTPDEINRMFESDKDLQEMYAKSFEGFTATQGERFSKQGSEAQRSKILMTARALTGDIEAGGEEARGRVERELGTRKETVAEVAKGAAATGQLASLENFNRYVDDLTKSSKMYSEKVADLAAVNDVLLTNLKNGADVTKRFTEQLMELSDALAEKGFTSGKAR